jgi:hypothetical protein
MSKFVVSRRVIAIMEETWVIDDDIIDENDDMKRVGLYPDEFGGGLKSFEYSETHEILGADIYRCDEDDDIILGTKQSFEYDREPLPNPRNAQL